MSNNFRVIVFALLVAFCCGKTFSSRIQEQWDYECAFDGERHPHEIACNRYYECRLNGGVGWIIYLYKCPEGYKYNGSINTCVPGSCDVAPVTTELPEITTEENVETTTEENFETTSEENFETTTEENFETTTEENFETTTEERFETTTEENFETTTEENDTTTEQDFQTTTERETSAPTKEPEVPTTPAPFICQGSGYFVDPYDCSVFHHCVCTADDERDTWSFEDIKLDSESVEDELLSWDSFNIEWASECADHVFKCPVGYHFCENIQTCAKDYCECKSA